MLSRAHRIPLLTLVLLLVALAAVTLSPRRSGRPVRLPPRPPPTTRGPRSSWRPPSLRSSSAAASSPAWLPDERFTYRSTTADGVRVRPGRSRQDDAGAGLRPRETGGGARRRGRRHVRPDEAAIPGHRALGRREVGVVRRRERSAGRATSRARPARRRRPARAGSRRGDEAPAAGAAAEGAAAPPAAAVTSPDGKRAVFIRDWNLWVRDVATSQEKAAHHRRRQGLRLRHRQRRLGTERPRHRALVARLEEGRDVPAGRAQGRRHVPGRDEGRSSGAQSVEVPAARATRRRDAPSRRSSTPIAGATVRFQMPPDYHRATLGDNFSLTDMTWSPDAGTARVRLDVARSQVGHAPRGRRRDGRRAHGVRRDGADAVRIAHRLAGAVGDQRGRSGTPSATTGATSICTTSPRAS